MKWHQRKHNLKCQCTQEDPVLCDTSEVRKRKCLCVCHKDKKNK